MECRVKNYLKIAFIFFLALNISGCAELRRKFVRKKKPRKEEYAFYRVEEYRPAPPQERYKEHYILWRNWHLDLERTDGTSHLRDIMAANEAMRHLTAMRDLLEEEKAEKLDIQIKNIKLLVAKLKKTKRDIMKDPHSRKLVERVGRVVTNHYSYKRMKDYIKTYSPGGIVKESEEK